MSAILKTWTTKGDAVFPAPRYPKLHIDGNSISFHKRTCNRHWQYVFDGDVFLKSPFNNYAYIHLLEFLDILKKVYGFYYEDEVNELARPYHNHVVPQWYLRKAKERAGRYATVVAKDWVRDKINRIDPEWWGDQKLMWSTYRSVPTQSTVEFMKKMPHKDYRWLYACRCALHIVGWRNTADWIEAAYGDIIDSKKKRKVLFRQPGNTFETVIHNIMPIADMMNFLPPSDRQTYILLGQLGYRFRFYGWSEEDAQLRLACVQRSSLYNIHKAFRYIAQAQYANLVSLRKWRDTVMVAGYIMDGIPAQNDTVFDWARRSIAQHGLGGLAPNRRLRRQYVPYEDDVKRAMANEKVVFPELLVKPPAGFIYLADSHMLAQETLDMGHCVVTYQHGCANGNSFIFHGNGATVQLSREGTVIQSHGKHNTITEETETAANVMRQWAQQNKWLPKDLPEETMDYNGLPF